MSEKCMECIIIRPDARANTFVYEEIKAIYLCSNGRISHAGSWGDWDHLYKPRILLNPATIIFHKNILNEARTCTSCTDPLILTRHFFYWWKPQLHNSWNERLLFLVDCIEEQYAILALEALLHDEIKKLEQNVTYSENRTFDLQAFSMMLALLRKLGMC